MSGSCARFLRWDRAGCVVSASFDIREQPDLLCEFLWRFSRMTPSGRGHDLSVQPALPAEETLFREAIIKHVRLQLEVEGEELKKAVTQHYHPGSVYVVEVLHHNLNGESENLRRFIVSRPTVSPLSLAGRGTKGYWAVDASNHHVVFLKDTWRLRSSPEVEGETLRRLAEKGVRYVPSMVCHGDVPDCLPDEPRKLSRKTFQRTSSDQVLREPWVCRVHRRDVHVSRLVHYRLVMGVVGYSLKHVRGSEELLYATYDVYTGMRDALAKDSRIHRDLSVGNIILVKEPDRNIRRGYLIDWEASCKGDDAGEACEPGRVGTWQFVSIRMLHAEEAVEGKHTFQDDMESLLYVVLYASLMWQPHNLTQARLTTIIRNMFDDTEVVSGGIKEGGSGKIANSMNRYHTRSVRFESAGLAEWLDTVLNYHSPLKHLEVEYKDKWSNPDDLATYWATFLQTHTLERDNRVVHTLDVNHLYDPPSEVDRPPSPAPAAVPPSSRKRVDTRGTKRTRAGEALDSSVEGRASSSGPPAPRRSQRIMQQPTHLEPAAVVVSEGNSTNTRIVPTPRRKRARSTLC